MLYRFYASSADDSETRTLAIVEASGDEDAMTRGEASAGGRALRAARLYFNIPAARALRDDDGFFTVEALEDADRLENALADMPSLPACIRERADVVAAAILGAR